MRLLLLTVAACASACGRAEALPIFAREYGVPCQKCHTVIPALNGFGAAFSINGYHLPGVGAPPAVFPVSVKANVQYTSAPDPGLPKAVVDEIELLSAGTVGPRGNYFAEQYLVDGGQHGNLREAWFNERLTADASRVPVQLRAGQFTLALPVDPESFRESASHYALFDQTVGANAFKFFDPKLGIALRLGKPDHAVLDMAALAGHDVQSGLPTTGIDLMQSFGQSVGPIDLRLYRYIGRRRTDRSLAAGDAPADDDRFTRTGLGLRFFHGRWTSESAVQENTDSNFDGRGTALHSSGGYSQLRYAITAKLFALLRYDATSDDRGLARSTTALLGYRMTHNTRVTAEDVLTHTPFAVHTGNVQFTVAY